MVLLFLLLLLLLVPMRWWCWWWSTAIHTADACCCLAPRLLVLCPCRCARSAKRRCRGTRPRTRRPRRSGPAVTAVACPNTAVTWRRGGRSQGVDSTTAYGCDRCDLPCDIPQDGCDMTELARPLPTAVTGVTCPEAAEERRGRGHDSITGCCCDRCDLQERKQETKSKDLKSLHQRRLPFPPQFKAVSHCSKDQPSRNRCKPPKTFMYYRREYVCIDPGLKTMSRLMCIPL